jgi:predicted kinase
MPRPRLLVITGPPASGKTTLARLLAPRYTLACLEKDTIKEPLLDVLGATDAAAAHRLSDASFAVLFALARAQLEAGCGMLIEGNFRAAEHAPVLRALVARTLQADPVERASAQILCRTDESLRRQRLAARAHDPARHPGHRDLEQSAAPTHGADEFLDLPGQRFTFHGQEGSVWRDFIATLDAWWHGD